MSNDIRKNGDVILQAVREQWAEASARINTASIQKMIENAAKAGGLTHLLLDKN